ncbi:hypothetical protein GF336_00590 [Candidatus Woesearchaeota archaeon]|nr:hypothetical protein [Candidatus Woesearchaeota archaeon]
MIKYFIWISLFVLLVPICFASGPEWSLTVTGEPDSEDYYVGGSDPVSFSFEISNQNSVCKILCAARIGGITSWEWADNWIEAGQTGLGGISGTVPEESSPGLTLEVKCMEEDTMLCGGENTKLHSTIHLENVFYEGDGDCTTGNPMYEDCMSVDCSCDSDEYCSPGHSKEDNKGCVEWCGDGDCDAEDNYCPQDCDSFYDCGSFGNTCSPGYECQDGECVSLCGNGVVDSGEDCDGNDMDNQNCKSLGYDYGNLRCTAGCEFDKSDCERCTNECSQVNKKEKVGNGFKICEEDSNGCLKWSSVKSCGSGETFEDGRCIRKIDCGDGICDQGESCSKDNCCDGNTVDLSSDEDNCGFCGNECDSLICIDGKCKGEVIELNKGCTSDAQCESGLCYDRVCQSGVSIKLGSQLSSLKVGKEMDIDLSIVNTIDDDIPVQLIIIKDSGMSVSGSDGAASGSMSQFTAFDGLVSRGQKSIILRIGALEPGTKELKGKVLYTVNGKQREYNLEEYLDFYTCGDGNCDSGEDLENCPADCKEDEDNSYSFFESILEWIKGIFGGD